MATGASLETYWKKRRFGTTPEPKGKVGSTEGHLYTVQKHDATRLHYDLRLELDGVLLSWAVTRGPSLDPADKRLAVRTEDHPLDYATFEGRIPEGEYGGGTVMLWDKGTWEPTTDPRKGLKDGRLKFHLHGERLKGAWALIRMKPRKGEKRENWLLIKDRDQQADRERVITEEAMTSVASKREMEQIANDPNRTWRGSGKPQRRGGSLPAFCDPMLATLVDEVPAGDDWIYEVKFDGYRIQAAVAGDKVRLYTRKGLDWTEKFGRLPVALADLGLDRVLLDGEVAAVTKEGRTDFSALQEALGKGGGGLQFFVFDLLAEGGKSLRNMPLIERKTRLRSLLSKAGRHGPVFYADHIEGGGEAMLRELCSAGFEGIIAKRAQSTYRSGRGKSWLKIKCDKSQEFVIVGWRPSDRDRPFSSILLAQHGPHGLIYAGRAGSGFDAGDLEQLAARFKALARRSPAVEDVPRAIRREARWIEPRLVAQIAFAGFTGDGMVRHGRFIGLREDKVANEVKPERPARTGKGKAMASDEGKAATVAGVRITHPDRVLFPQQGVTKRDLAQYLAAAAPRMLPHLTKRLVSLVRCPAGRQKQCFFQRHAGKGFPDVFQGLPVRQKDGRTEDYLYLTDREAIVTAAQVGVLELHIWGSRIDAIDKPDRIVFDLDPDPAVDFDEVKRAAGEMRQALEALDLESFCLLTGGKGVHVVVPVERRHTWPVVSAFSRALAERFEEQAPRRFVASMSKAKRKGRIFIDHFRNQRGSSAIAPYSPRAREGAPVAWPVAWKDLDGIETPQLVTLGNAAGFLKKKDPWADYGKVRQSLKKAALDALGVETG